MTLMAQAITQPEKTAVVFEKHLTFTLADEQYGIEILKVREIVGMTDITRVPRTPAFVKGIINLRGKIVPVMDLRMKCGMPPAERTPDTCIIVLELARMEMGVIVDKVLDVLDIPRSEIEETPSFGVEADTAFIQRVAKMDGRVVLLLDIAKVLTSGETRVIGQAARTGQTDVPAITKEGGV
jgi:purine-binding chemotaxis protein CheW